MFWACCVSFQVTLDMFNGFHKRYFIMWHWISPHHILTLFLLLNSILRNVFIAMPFCLTTSSCVLPWLIDLFLLYGLLTECLYFAVLVYFFFTFVIVFYAVYGNHFSLKIIIISIIFWPGSRYIFNMPYFFLLKHEIIISTSQLQLHGICF